MSTRIQEIRAALLVKLQGINGTLPYVTTVGEVSEIEKPIATYTNYPVLVLQPMHGDTDDAEGVPLRHVIRSAFWEVGIIALSRDSNEIFAGSTGVSNACFGNSPVL